MKRSELEHLIRAAAAITNQYEFVVIGSQSILGAFPNAPDDLLQSMEADMYPLDAPDRADMIDGSIGEASIFHERFGYYAQGVGPETAILPAGWRDRLVRIQGPGTDLKVGLCLEPHDLVASKLAAHRDKDLDFAKVALKHGIVKPALLRERIFSLPMPEQRRASLAWWVAGQVATPDKPGNGPKPTGSRP